MPNETILVRGNKLEILQQLAVALLNDRGWKHRGMRGWMFSDEFDRLPVAMDHGARSQLLRDMMIERDDVHDPGRRQPQYLFRITQFGFEVLQGMGLVPADAKVELPLERTEETGDTIFMSMVAWQALEYLGKQSRQQGGWVEMSTIRSDATPSFLPDDVHFLVGRGLVEVNNPPHATRRRYRATALGRRARALDVTTIKTRAQVLVPGIRKEVQPPRLAAPRRRAADTLSGG